MPQKVIVEGGTSVKEMQVLARHREECQKHQSHFEGINRCVHGLLTLAEEEEDESL